MTLRAKILTSIAAFIVVTVVFLLVSVRTGSRSGDGERVGSLIDIRLDGSLWARPAATFVYEGETHIEDFALDDDVIYRQAKAAADISAAVRIEYAYRHLCFAWNYARCSIITKIEIIRPR